MGTLYTSLDVKQYSELLQTKNLPLFLTEKKYIFEFTEDKSYWIKKMGKQDDLENVVDYRYSIIIEFEIEANIINSIVQSEESGRLSTKIINYYKSLNKPITSQEFNDNDLNILSILDVYESDETVDGISQLWRLVVDSTKSKIWKTFTEGVFKISCLGGIPGAVEEAQKIASC